ncbi:MAG: undecaprenyl-phosphate glucose phosphotransferase [Halobacteriovoraceae bacterium]|nr:undecaprenyl-phosphate glucose phosphotransferase [Halobacteriovoraceae bacterium]|tara:strand:- start:14158 stop:15504 length:1347 start_codon:yes stop_codon:yes gene_type:complete
MNQNLKTIDYIQRTVDCFIVLTSFAIAYYIKFFLQLGGIETGEVFLDRYIGFGFILLITSSIVFKNSKVYDSVRYDSLSKEIFLQLKANLITLVVFLVLSFFISHFRVSRIVLILYFIISSISLTMSKIYFRKMITKIPAKFIFVGSGQTITEFYNKIKKIPNFKILYWVDAPEDLKDIQVKTKLDLKEIEEKKLGTLVLGYDLSASNKLNTILKNLSEYLIPVIVLPDHHYSRLGHAYRDFKGQTLLFLNDPKANTLNLIFKRAFDIIAVGCGLLIISPLLLCLALLVKFSSKGPVLYGQTRLGVDGREFKMWKFRSMVVGDANHGGWTVENDPRVTKVGRFLRKTSLDELPQLWNVLVGEMSLVGPRPERPQYVSKFREEIPSYMLRHKFKAGITGWAQINGWRGDTSIEKRIECDLWYIKNWSFGLDIYILFMTFWKGFINKNAY